MIPDLYYRIQEICVLSICPAASVWSCLYHPDIYAMIAWMFVWYSAIAIVCMEKEKK